MIRVGTGIRGGQGGIGRQHRQRHAGGGCQAPVAHGVGGPVQAVVEAAQQGMRLRVAAPAQAAQEITLGLAPQLAVQAEHAQCGEQVRIGRALLQPGLGLGQAARHLVGFAASVSRHQGRVELDGNSGFQHTRRFVGFAGGIKGGRARQGDVGQQAFFGFQVFPDGAPGVAMGRRAQTRRAGSVDQGVGFGASQRVAAHQAASQGKDLIVVMQRSVRAQQQTHRVQVASAAVSQGRKHCQRAFGAALVQQHIGRYRCRGFNHARIRTGLLLRGGQQAVATIELAQAVRGASRGQGGQHAARLHLGLVEQFGQVFFGDGVAAFQQADPAAFQQFMVARLRTLAAPHADAVRNGKQPGQQAQAHIKHDEGRHDQQHRQRERHVDAPRPDQQQHVAGMRAQHHRQGDGDDGEQQCPEPGTHKAQSCSLVLKPAARKAATAFKLSATSGMRTAMSVCANSRASVCAATVSGERLSKYLDKVTPTLSSSLFQTAG
ncbi:hypothetical protein D3C71_1203630 [compost metagenome]